AGLSHSGDATRSVREPRVVVVPLGILGNFVRHLLSVLRWFGLRGARHLCKSIKGPDNLDGSADHPVNRDHSPTGCSQQSAGISRGGSVVAHQPEPALGNHDVELLFTGFVPGVQIGFLKYLTVHCEAPFGGAALNVATRNPNDPLHIW